MIKKVIFLVAITFVILLLDQITKIYVHSNFALHESLYVIGDFFSITYVRNPGAAFGFLSDAPDFFRKAFFLTITPMALVGLSYFLWTLREDDRLQMSAVCLVFSGAIGNYIDRIRFQYVIDFLYFNLDWLDFTLPFFNKIPLLNKVFPDVSFGHFPAFNVADMAIVCGITVLFACTFVEEQQKKKLEA